MNNKRVPPSVAQFAVSERAELLARIAELGVTIARLESQLSRAIQANYDLRTKLVVPSPDVLGRAFITCESSDAGYRVVIKSERMQEAQQLHNWLARLNAAPVQQVSVPVWMASARAFADRLYMAGWRDHSDAQHSGVAGMYDELLSSSPAAPAADAPSVEMVQAACAAFRMDISPMLAMHDALCAALAAYRAHGVV